MDDNSPKEFYLSKNSGFGKCSSEDDYLHKALNDKVAGDSATETQYFPLSVPEHSIHGVMYIWYHTNLKVVTGGAWVWQGIKTNRLSSELADMRSYMSDSVLGRNIDSYALDNGYSVSVIEPMKRLRVSYSDASRDNHVSVEYRAIADAVMQNNGLHFTQPMKAIGELVLRGKRYAVDSYAMRDRSWGALRSEEHQNLPPVSWATCIFNEGFYFNCTAFDHPEANPIWIDRFHLKPDQVLSAGYIFEGGKFAEIVYCKKRTTHDKTTSYPAGIDIEFIDELGREYVVEGTVISACSWSAWFNVDVAMCLVRWKCRNSIGFGEVQEARWNDYMVKIWGDKQ